MLINNSTSFNRISESYLKAASFETQKTQSQDKVKLPASESNEANPPYTVTLSGEAKEASEKEEKEKKEKQDGENKKETSAQEPWRKGKSESEQRRIEQEIKDLKQTQENVIKHEQTHKSVGGQYAGAINYSKTSGPDGKQYIVGGEVSIDTSKEDTPQKTITKMQIVRRAALAPADPSGADRAAASEASSKESAARKELSKEMQEKSKKAMNVGAEKKVFDFFKVFKDKKAREQEPTMGKLVDLSA